MIKISASILSADLSCLAQECSRMLSAGADLLHIDVMDGHFVPNISFGAPVLASLRRALPDAEYDVHLMIEEPARYASAFANAGAGWITFHYEAVPDAVPQTVAAIRAADCRAGISVSPGTPVEAVFPYLDQVDLVLVMSVEPGFGGQSFIPGTPARLAALRAECDRRGLGVLLSVDGGINAQTGPLCAAAGADWLVAGTSLLHAPDPAALVRQLHAGPGAETPAR